MRGTTASLVGAALLAAATGAGAYPGGTPGYQTDAAPFCASCHSSRDEAVLAGAPEDYAAKQLAENKHYPLVLRGEGEYGRLTPAQREELVAHLRAVDEASKVEMKAPASVEPGETFKITVNVTGGAGPVVGVALVDDAHRWLARPAPSAGWQVVGPPTVIGQDFKEQTEWIERRPESKGRNLSFVNVGGIASDATKAEWGRADVVFTLRAPTEPGVYPLAAAYWYGTEKASPHGYTEDPIRGKLVRGGLGGHSGRVIFTPVSRVRVEARSPGTVVTP